MRKNLGEALKAYGAKNSDVVVLDADVSSSTMTKLFGEAFPERFFNIGIAEAGMVDTAVGLALGGKIPFVSSFAAMLCYRGLEQIRTCVAYNRVAVKLLAGYAGVSDYKDGPTHHSVFDIAIMRAMPNMTVVTASDGQELYSLIPLVAEYPGPVYLRISREDVPCVFDDKDPLEIGKGRILAEGKDVTLIATGVVLHRTLKARALLAKQGIDAQVVELHTLKPIDTDTVLQCALETAGIVTIEEHSIIGGLFGAVAEILALNPQIGKIPVYPVGLRDSFACTGPDPETLWDHVGLRTENIVDAARHVLNIHEDQRKSDENRCSE
jgi:transketolase